MPETGDRFPHVIMLSFNCGFLQVMLAKYSGQEDVVVGTPIANRDMAEVQNMLGPFVKCGPAQPYKFAISKGSESAFARCALQQASRNARRTEAVG